MHPKAADPWTWSLLPSVLTFNYCRESQTHTFIPANADPIRTPHFVLSSAFIISSVIPPSANAFFPAVSP